MQSMKSMQCDHEGCENPISSRCHQCNGSYCVRHINFYRKQYICDKCRIGTARGCLFLVGIAVMALGLINMSNTEFFLLFLLTGIAIILIAIFAKRKRRGKKQAEIRKRP